ncbi:ATP-binding protein [Bradyrhizobium sp. SZCCHNR1070]|uniref:AAA family ATPase n=1 Tax=Bradyrhizobium sp. SZCCHNR1070 TaxID=3057361 RepID=UPI0029161206|nr:ATP-binding protein [Bradyrhizobium sp. SZCCHNR1070]
MRSPRRKPITAIEPGLPLIPLKLARNDTFSNLVEAVVPNKTREQLVLSPHNIRTFIGLIEEFRGADLLRRHGMSVRSKLLFCGPPGCGKTLTAEVFAHELGLPLIIARLDAIISSFLGETAANIRKVFETASEQPCVLFLDEFDALARARADGSEHNELRRVVNSLLMLIDRFKGKGFLVAATNLEESLDAAIWRRFDEVVVFELPSQREIRRLCEIKLKNFPAPFSVSEKAPRLKGMSFADVERICENAIKRSILKRSKVLLETEFDTAIREELRRKDLRARLHQH